MLVAGFLFTNACTKPGTGGKAHIHGHVEIEATKTVAVDAEVEIWYDATSASGTSDNKVHTDIDGKFEFEGLTKGDYYLSASFTDTSGTALTGGAAVTIDKKTGEFEVDLHLE